ncbi:MAG: prolyl hydroxylase family protein [Chakrabartia sp.]
MAKIKLKTPQQRLADFGRIVGRRLAAATRVQPVTQNGLTLYCLQDFMSRAECEELIGLINKGRQPSGLLSATADPDFRTSDSCNLSPYDPLVERIEDRICTLMGIDKRHGETLQGQVYEVGQQFKPHFDHFLPGSVYWDEMMRQGGQRSWTAMIYLNEPAAGGETEFPTAGLTVGPRTAMLLLWNNMQPDGTPNPAALHAGKPVLAGTKYIVTKWFREKFWV